MSLPIFTPNKTLAETLLTMAVQQDSLALAHISATIHSAAVHYAVDANAYPAAAAYSAACCVAARIRNGEWNHNV